MAKIIHINPTVILTSKASSSIATHAMNRKKGPRCLVTATSKNPSARFISRTARKRGKIKVELRPVNIHSEDGLVLYIPKDHILLAGDTLEDTLTFIVEPEQIPTHYKNLQKMKQWNIDRIYPNHGNPDVIANGGYKTTLIDATQDYLHQVVMRAHDRDYLKGSVEDYVHDSVAKGWVSVWWAYREAHAANLALVAKAYKNRPLPDLASGSKSGVHGAAP